MINTVETTEVYPTMKVTLLQRTDIEIAALAIRKCADSVDRLDSVGNLVGANDVKLIKHCIKNGHHSVFEHIIYTFEIENISRALLQELSRHRIASPSVQSTRWALRKLIKKIDTNNFEETARLYLRSVEPEIDEANIKQLRFVVDNIDKFTNDKLKYALPEAFLTTELLTINVRSLWNLLTLRLSKRALWEFRELSTLFLTSVEVEHPYLFENYK